MAVKERINILQSTEPENLCGLKAGTRIFLGRGNRRDFVGGLETFGDGNMKNLFKEQKERILKEMIGKRG